MEQELTELRKVLHKNPELAGEEVETAKEIERVFLPLKPTEVIKLGKTGIAFVFKGKDTGPTIMFRAELDALPIQEESDLPYCSQNPGKGHLCGHDGHMAILFGLGKKIALNRPDKGMAILLYQPAEETGQGAHEMINTPEFIDRWPDCIFGLHNIPSYQKGAILLRNGPFAASSRGMIIKLKGRTSHASEPDKGTSPVKAIAKLIRHFEDLQELVSMFSDFILCTIIQIRMGNTDFGTNPGEAEVMVTLRSFEEADMQRMISESENAVKRIAEDEELSFSISYTEIFPATENDKGCIDILRKAAKRNKFKVVNLKEPFRWSEDFGYYNKDIKAGFFGLGSGIDQPGIHSPNYDFPDEIIEPGVSMFYSVYQSILKND